MIQSGKSSPAVSFISILATLFLHLIPLVWLLFPKELPLEIRQPPAMHIRLLAPPPAPPPPPPANVPKVPPPLPSAQPEKTILSRDPSPVKIKREIPRPKAKPKEKVPSEKIKKSPPPGKVIKKRPRPAPHKEKPRTPPQKREISRPESRPQVKHPPSPPLITEKESLKSPAAQPSDRRTEIPSPGKSTEEQSDGLPDRAPVPYHVIRPVYPSSARRRGLEGRVTCLVTITPEGRAKKASILYSSGHSVLDEAALKAVRRAQFRPAQRKGKAVGAETRLTFFFKLR